MDHENEMIGYLPGSLEDKLGYRLIRQFNKYTSCYTEFSQMQIVVLVNEALNTVQTRKLKRKLRIDSDDLRFQYQEGTKQFSSVLPKKKGGLTRLAVAWWTDNGQVMHVRVYSDRIHLVRIHVESPRVFPFGQQPYHHIFSAQDPHHCLKCRSHIEIGTGVWRGDHFLCQGCQYAEDAGGLRPGFHLIGSKKRK